MKSDFEKIHNISESFNRTFGGPIFIFSALVIGMLVILPYRGRLALSFIINIFFNRPSVYFNYLKKYLLSPLILLLIGLFYFTIVGLYAVIYRLKNHRFRKSSGWKSSPPSTNLESGRYQS